MTKVLDTVAVGLCGIATGLLFSGIIVAAAAVYGVACLVELAAMERAEVEDA